jgi:hypothetical protein
MWKLADYASSSEERIGATIQPGSTGTAPATMNG